MLPRAFGCSQLAGGDGSAVVGATVAEFDIRAHRGEKLARGLDVTNLRNVFEYESVFGEQGGGHARQGRILGAAGADRAEQRIAAAND